MFCSVFWPEFCGEISFPCLHVFTNTGYVTASHPETLGKTSSAQSLLWCNHMAETWPQASHSIKENYIYIHQTLLHVKLAFENTMKRKEWHITSQMVSVSQTTVLYYSRSDHLVSIFRWAWCFIGEKCWRLYLTIKNFRTTITTNVIDIHLWLWNKNRRVIQWQERLNGYRLPWKPDKHQLLRKWKPIDLVTQLRSKCLPKILTENLYYYWKLLLAHRVTRPTGQQPGSVLQCQHLTYSIYNVWVLVVQRELKIHTYMFITWLTFTKENNLITVFGSE